MVMKIEIIHLIFKGEMLLYSWYTGDWWGKLWKKQVLGLIRSLAQVVMVFKIIHLISMGGMLFYMVYSGEQRWKYGIYMCCVTNVSVFIKKLWFVLHLIIIFIEIAEFHYYYIWHIFQVCLLLLISIGGFYTVCYANKCG